VEIVVWPAFLRLRTDVKPRYIYILGMSRKKKFRIQSCTVFNIVPLLETNFYANF
jgi:hypothetical protein